MSVKNISFLFLLFIPSLLTAGGNQEYSDQSRIEYEITNFDGIDGSAAFEIEVRQGDRYSVVVYADKSIQNKLLVQKRGATLHLGMKPFSGLIWNKSPKAIITMPSLELVGLSGASNMVAAGFRDERRFKADLSGASSLDIDITADSAEIELSGASDMTAVLETSRVNLDFSGSSSLELVGYGEDLTADLSGASSGDLSDFRIASAAIELSGSSDLRINLDGKLQLDASGASTLYYTGNVELDEIDLSSASSIKKE